MTVTGARRLLICGVAVDPLDTAEAADRIVALGASRTPASVHLCNAFVLALASRDRSYACLLNRSDLNLPDGAPVAWIGRRLGLKMERVAGMDLMLEVLRRGRSCDLRHYFYGSTPHVVNGMVEELKGHVGGVNVVGAESPPFRHLSAEEADDVVARIRGCRPHVVWVGLGTPRQDEFVETFHDRLGAVLVPVGAAFDFLAGSRLRAPTWVQRIGLEWLHRLVSEPRRLWRRYLVGNLVFLWTVFKERPQVVRPEPER
jgi:N-acetylglucosaminyldiphosphoundecaprenol N-acetyl-beta-D-mannosaminyltransferase